jgi:hypothetical protein
VLDITLTAPFSDIDKQRDKSLTYEGMLSYTDSDNNIVQIESSFEVRGNWRLQKQNCGHAQLWVDLKRSQTEGTLFENQNRLKLVVQCGRQEREQQWLIKEQLAYDLFTSFSDIYFDTRLLNIRYIDTENDGAQRTHMGFFIEHQNRLADRFEMEKVEENSIDRNNLAATQANAVALFMYMIGNTDFSLSQGAPEDECCHNAKLLLSDAGEYYALPYDFDASGFVDTAYAPLPTEAMGIRSNKQRRFRGYCSHTSNLAAAITQAAATQQEVAALVAGNSYLSDRMRRNAMRYIDEFYEILASERKVEREIFDDCR